MPASVFAAEPAVLSSESISLADAIQATLANQPGVEITRQQVLQRAGNAQSASGQFDWALGSFYSRETNRTPTGTPPPFLAVHRVETSIYGFGFAKQFRNGISVTPQVSVVDARDNVSSPAPFSQSDLSLTITVPLLRGLGAKTTGATEAAARTAVRAQEAQARFQLEQIVYQTASAYWNCLAARRNLEILIDTAASAQKVFSTVEVFAKGGELDSATLDQSRALVSTRQAEREDGELTYFQARQALGLALGLGAKQLARVPDVSSEFPAVIDVTRIPAAIGEKYVSESLARRGDYLAAGLNVDAQQLLLDQARGNLKPQLDLDLKLGYAGRDARADRFRPAYALSNDLTGVNALGSFTFQWPIANNVARGAYVSQRATLEQAKLNSAQAANGVASSVLVALETLRKTIAQYQLSTQAVDTYKRAVEQTGEKLKVGEASLTELIDVQDRYASARRVQIDTIRRYAVTLAQLRLLTGTLSSVADKKATFEVGALGELPFAQ
ncbi:MAG TPA: TolC family protein [Opitutaceae bacterium]|nr:TolC family protein [Opitutaceae bacterium]